MTLRIGGFATLLQVFDMPTSLAFYRDVLGMSFDGDEHWSEADLSGVRFALHEWSESVPEPGSGGISVNFRVDDADAAAERAGELGGTVIAPPFDVMELGRMAVIQDPTGAFFSVWQARSSIGAELVNGHGLLSLNQLNTTDPERASEFYSALFGWRFDAVPDTEIPYWGIYRGESLNGGMMQQPDGSPAPPHWLVYFGVDDIDAASEKVGAAGGSVLVPKTEVPGGEFIVAADPQGAIFAVFAGRFDD
jgi:predicted enzyme related to lactoylglutathione lyase